MAIVVDAARENLQQPATDMRFMEYFAAAAVETHIGFAYETGVDNTLDAWVPHVATGSDATVT